MSPRKIVKRQRKAGLPPGALVASADSQGTAARLWRIEYNEKKLTETVDTTHEIGLAAGTENHVTWLNVDGLEDIETIERLSKAFGVHTLILEDALNTQQRPKMEIIGDHLFFPLKMLQWNEAENIVETEQVSLILGKNYVISIQERQGDVFEAVRDRMRNSVGKIRTRRADYLLFALIDVIVDNYFHVVEQLGERINHLEEAVFAKPEARQLKEIHDLKYELITLRRSVFPLREALARIEKEEFHTIEEITLRYFRDIYDHVIQLIDTIESYRDINSGLKDTYMSSVSFKMNQVMQVLTIISTIFIPLTFLAGIYGMNFEFMPELKWHYSYAVFWCVIVAMGIALLLFFRRKKWL